jgi:hypothetical protein
MVKCAVVVCIMLLIVPMAASALEIMNTEKDDFNVTITYMGKTEGYTLKSGEVLKLPLDGVKIAAPNQSPIFTHEHEKYVVWQGKLWPHRKLSETEKEANEKKLEKLKQDAQKDGWH